jgi:hypothetical protein
MDSFVLPCTCAVHEGLVGMSEFHFLVIGWYDGITDCYLRCNQCGATYIACCQRIERSHRRYILGKSATDDAAPFAGLELAEPLCIAPFDTTGETLKTFSSVLSDCLPPYIALECVPDISGRWLSHAVAKDVSTFPAPKSLSELF